jgi:hypothetical protein
VVKNGNHAPPCRKIRGISGRYIRRADTGSRLGFRSILVQFGSDFAASSVMTLLFGRRTTLLRTALRMWRILVGVRSRMGLALAAVVLVL